jgi:hypothetical protein
MDFTYVFFIPNDHASKLRKSNIFVDLKQTMHARHKFMMYHHEVLHLHLNPIHEPWLILEVISWIHVKYITNHLNY